MIEEYDIIYDSNGIEFINIEDEYKSEEYIDMINKNVDGDDIEIYDIYTERNGNENTFYLLEW